ncbi:MAG: hypothetical protein WA652_10765, partial [Xanthobacteraceae bacterium]
MSEYDDENIRLYTPFLQRIIILLAVIIAVPVVMWTITTVVRTYFAAPKAPTFQRLTENQSPDAASDAVQAAAPAAGQAPAPSGRMADPGAASPPPHTPLLEIKKPADQPQVKSGAPAAAPQIAVATVQPSAVQPPPAPASFAQPTPAAPAQPSTAAVARPMVAPAIASAAPASAAPSMPAPPVGSMPGSASKAPAAATAVASNIAWPNPNTNAPPDLAMDGIPKSAKLATAPAP